MSVGSLLELQAKSAPSDAQRTGSPLPSYLEIALLEKGNSMNAEIGHVFVDGKGDTKDINLNFLRKIIPNDGALLITQIKDAKASNIPCSDFNAMGQLLRDADLSGYDAYHACASFKDSTSREARNAKSLKALFLDLDCGEDKAKRKQGYATKSDAGNALKVFCKSIGLPRPILVDSGGGIHAYWPFKTAVPAADWKIVAEGLKSLCETYGLFADRQVTADAARILRPVGSHNRKYSPHRLVKLIRDAECVDFEGIRAIINTAVTRLEAVNARRNTRTAHQSTTTASPISVAEQVNPNRYRLNEVEEALKHLNPECPRDEWYPVGMAIADAFGEPGRDLFLRWSRGDLEKRA